MLTGYDGAVELQTYKNIWMDYVNPKELGRAIGGDKMNAKNISRLYSGPRETQSVTDGKGMGIETASNHESDHEKSRLNAQFWYFGRRSEGVRTLCGILAFVPTNYCQCLRVSATLGVGEKEIVGQ